MCNDFWQKVQQRAYFRFLDRQHNNIKGNAWQDWIDAELEEKLESKIEEEAFLRYLKSGDESFHNYIEAKHDVDGRIRYLAYYMHEKNYNKNPDDNWVEAKKLYVNEF